MYMLYSHPAMCVHCGRYINIISFFLSNFLSCSQKGHLVKNILNTNIYFTRLPNLAPHSLTQLPISPNLAIHLPNLATHIPNLATHLHLTNLSIPRLFEIGRGPSSPCVHTCTVCWLPFVKRVACPDRTACPSPLGYRHSVRCRTQTVCSQTTQRK